MYRSCPSAALAGSSRPPTTSADCPAPACLSGHCRHWVRVRRSRFSGCAGCGCGLAAERLAESFGIRVHIDRAAKLCTVFETDARGENVAPDLRALADADPFGGIKVPVDRAFHKDGVGEDFRVQRALRADCERIALQFHRPLDAALDDQVLFPLEVTVDGNRRADGRGPGCPAGASGRRCRLVRGG